MHHYALSFGYNFLEQNDFETAAKQSRLRRIEYSCGDFPKDEIIEKHLKFLQRLQAEKTLEVASVHVPFWPFDKVCPASLDEDKRRNAVGNIAAFIRKFAPLGTKNFTLHASGEPNDEKDRSSAMTAARKTITELVPVMKETGASLNVEVLPRTCLGRNPEEIMQLIDGLPEEQVGVCFDINHLCGAPERIPEAVRIFGRRLKSCHCSDYDGVDECHWYPGLGRIDFPAFMREIQALPQDVLLILELTLISAPEGEKRSVESLLLFHSGEKAAFCMENAERLEKEWKNFQIP